MNRRLWHTIPKVIERKRFIDPITASLMGAGILAGVGGSTNWFGLGGKKKDKGGQFNYYASPDYQKLRDLLYQREGQGYFNEMKPAYTQMWNQQIMPQILEQTRAKRNIGYSTPETTQLGAGWDTAMSDMYLKDLTARQNALQMLAQITGQPTTTYTPESAGLFENLLSFGAPIASAGLSSYMQGNMWKDIMSRKSATDVISPEAISSLFNMSPYQPNYMSSLYGGY